MKRLLLLLSFIVGAPVLLVTGLNLTRVSFASQPVLVSPEINPAGAKIFAALPETVSSYNYRIEAGDARKLILENYLQQAGSPLAAHVDDLIAASDKFDLDFRLLVAISRQESNMCKFIPQGTYNCWGWGIHKRGTLGFDSYTKGIWTVAQGLRTDYLNRGLVTPEQIMTRYTPSSPGSWAAGVKQFMAEME